MKQLMKHTILILILGAVFNALCSELQESYKELSPTEYEVTLTFKIPKGTYLYKESLIASVNTPQVTFTPLTTASKPASFFDETYKKQKEGYTGGVVFKTIVRSTPELTSSDVILHTHYLLSSDKQPRERTIKLPFIPTKVQAPSPLAGPTPVKALPAAETLTCEPPQPSLLGNLVGKILNSISLSVMHARAALSSLFSHTGSKAMRCLAALLLGLLLSLTPCIYPMIPITIGILQASGTTSGSRNFLLALFYTLGISTTFAILGLIAAVGSCVFGELQGSPYIVLPLSALLLIFGLSMFDFFQIPIPQWLQPKTKVQGGSFSSAFIFGAATGTVASPCLSPGLVLILNYVANIASTSLIAYLEGFLLLFIFGIGSSIPLLIIGTFSGSLALLPKAGAWMIEIKKIVGVMLIVMALYHISHLERLFPWHLFIWVVVLTFLILGIYSYLSIKKYDSTGMRRYKNINGTAMIIIACIIAVQGQKDFIEHLFPQEIQQPWLREYDRATQFAQSQNKLLFIDIGATYCSACKALDKQIFQQQSIQDALALFTLLKVEADIDIATYEKVKELYGEHIVGYPTYLVVDPTTHKVIKKWSIEIDLLTLAGVEEEFKKLATEHSEKKH